MRQCACGAWPEAGSAWCGRCGRQLAGPPASRGVGAGMPWTIVLVLVLFGLAALACVVDLLFGVVFGGIAVSALDTLQSSGYSTESDAMVRGMQAGLVIAGITDVALLAFFGWAARAVYQRVALVRPLVVVKAAAEVFIAVTVHALIATHPLAATFSVVVGLGFDVAILVLLWVPTISRRWFGDTGPTAAVADLWPSRPVAAVPPPRHTWAPGPGASAPVPGRPGARRVPDEDPVTVRLLIPRHAVRPDIEPAPDVIRR